MKVSYAIAGIMLILVLACLGNAPQAGGHDPEMTESRLIIADSTNRYVTVWEAAPGLAQLEANVVRWFCQMVGYPVSAGGYLASGGSMANFSALFTARRERLPEDFLDGLIYVSDQIHHSVLRAATLAGFPGRALRTVGVDERFRIRIS